MSKPNHTRRLTVLPHRKPKTRKEMIAFLTDHLRYSTANSWNGGNSYAVKIKIHSLSLMENERTRVYEALDVESSFDQSGFNDILREFAESHDFRWQIGTNGRSGGYCVLYQGGRKASEYKSRCTNCGQLNYKEAVPENDRCGVCKSVRVNLIDTVYQTFTNCGGTDMDVDFDNWTVDDLQERVNLVWEFDIAVENACHAYLEWAMAHKVEERTVMVPHKVNVAVPR